MGWKSCISWYWWNYYGQSLLWSVILGCSLNINQAHSEWQWCLSFWYLSWWLLCKTSIEHAIKTNMDMEQTFKLNILLLWSEYHISELACHLLSSICPGCKIKCLVKQQELLLVLIIKIFSTFMSGVDLHLFWTLCFKMVIKFQNETNLPGWVTSLDSQVTTHLWWQLSEISGLVMSVINFILSLMISLKPFLVWVTMIL